MKRSIFLLITAALSLFIGAMCLLFPDKMASGFGMTVTPLILMLIREAGACNLKAFFLLARSLLLLVFTFCWQ